MNDAIITRDHSRLAHQGLGRDLSADEQALAEAMQRVFGEGQHDFAIVASKLQEMGVRRPSGSSEGWTVAALEQELASINRSLDEAYEKNGFGA